MPKRQGRGDLGQIKRDYLNVDPSDTRELEEGRKVSWCALWCGEVRGNGFFGII
jgi:hypothetical protein